MCNYSNVQNPLDMKVDTVQQNENKQTTVKHAKLNRPPQINPNQVKKQFHVCSSV